MAAERKTCDEVLRLIRTGRAELEAALARTPDERIEEPLLDGGWSAKDTTQRTSPSSSGPSRAP